MADNPENASQGLLYKYFEIASGQSYPAAGTTAKASGATGAFDLSVRKRDNHFTLSYSGYISIAEEGFYTFSVSADDEGRFYIGNELVAEKGNTALIGKKIGLKAGKHAIKLDYLQRTGSRKISLSYEGPGIARKEVSPLDLFHTGSPTLPDLFLRGPSSGSSFEAPAYQVYFETRDIAGVSKVDFYAGSTVVGTDSTFPYDYSWEVVPQGYYYISARAYTPTGAVSYSNVNAIKVRPVTNSAPSVSLVPLPENLYVSGEIVPFKVAVSDPDGKVVNVNYLVDSVNIGNIYVGDFSVNWYAAAGTHQVKAIAFDDNGDSTVSAPLTITVAPRDNVKPTISITSPPYGRAYFYPESVPFEVNAQDADGSVTKVKYYANDTLIQVRYAPSSFGWTWVNPAIRSGYNIRTVAFDNAGDSTVSGDIWIYVNPRPNQVAAIVSPATNSSFPALSTILLDVNTKELDEGTSLVQFYANELFIGQVSDTSFKFSWVNVAAGTYTVKAIAYDKKGLATYAAPITIVVTPAGDIIAPTCAARNQTIQLELNPARRTNASRYRWWTDASSAKSEGLPVWNVNTGAVFTSARFCVDVDYTNGTYTQFCKQISQCNSNREEAAFEEIASTEVLTIAPNPTSDVFKLTLKQAALSVSVTDKIGNVVFAASDLTEGKTVQFGAGFSNGLYNVVVVYLNNSKEVLKIMKQ